MEKNYSAEIKNIIALCNVIDEFEEFEKKLRKEITLKNNRNFIFQLWDVSNGKVFVGSRKAKKFYEENKTIIDIINKYSNVPTFINYNYDIKGNSNGSLEFFYNYLLNNKKEINKIIAVLEKLKKLGFVKFELNEELNFTEETQYVYTVFLHNYDLKYLDNLIAIPNYNPDELLYKSNNSNYKITVGVFVGAETGCQKEIVLNSLIFDPNRLPDDLLPRNIFNKLMGIKDQKQKEYSIINDSVQLGVGINNLEDTLNSFSLKINDLENVDKKKELIQLLSNIKQSFLEMKTISEEYNEEIVNNNPDISKEFLEEQKINYIKRK